MPKSRLIIVAIVVYLVATVGGYMIFKTVNAGPSNTATKTTSDTVVEGEEGSNEPKTEECPINGAMYGKTAKSNWEKRRPLAVVIENHPESRPQSGISSADVVYEAVSEGGVTRTLSIFYCQGAKFVGPVRSARVHFINLLREWGAYPLYAHVGGANCDEETGSGCGNGAPADALGLISELEWSAYNDLNQFSIPYPYFYRDYDRLPDVATEHTVYSSTDKLWKYAAEKRKLTNVDAEGVAWNKDWKPWKFVDDAPATERGDVKVISYDFYDTNVDEFGVRWEYDAKTNTYTRYNGGKPHKDLNTGKPITAKNVFVVLAAESPANDNYPGGHIVYDLTGEGDAFFFHNGKVIKGTWQKKDLDSKMVFVGEDGKEIAVVRGAVWISVLPEENEVKYGAAVSTKSATTGKEPTAAVNKTTTVEEEE